jgi:hypothetical protein
MLRRGWAKASTGDFACKIEPVLLEQTTNFLDLRMSDNPLDRTAAFNRVSIRAVLVKEGEDPTAALLEAGIVDPIAIRVVLGEDPHLSDGMLGDGRTPNLTAVLETEQVDDSGSSATSQINNTGSQPDAAPRRQPVTTMLPAASRAEPPLAPVRPMGEAGQDTGAQTGRFGYRDSGSPPTPSLFAQAGPAGTAEERKPAKAKNPKAHLQAN